jgi:ATP-dependent RNA helicase MSS116
LFRRSESAILFSSDVTARGMDFPDVTHIIQVGVPRDTETYIHRLGRTARANKTGEGWMLLSDVQYDEFRTRLRRLPIKEDSTSLQTATLDMTKEAQISASIASILTQIGKASKLVPYSDKSQAYMAMIGVLSGVRDKRELVRTLNNLATIGWQMTSPPRVSQSLARKMGIARIPGLNLSQAPHEEEDPAEDRDRFSRGDRGGDRGGFGRSNFGRGGFDRSSSRGPRSRSSNYSNRDSGNGYSRPNTRGNYGTRNRNDSRSNFGWEMRSDPGVDF